MDEQPTATHEIADDVQATAAELVLGQRLASKRTDRARSITEAIAAARSAGYRAGLAERQQLELEEAADDAHVSGYREGYGDASAVREIADEMRETTIEGYSSGEAYEECARKLYRALGLRWEA